LFNAIAKANYSSDKAAEYDKVFSEVFPAHLARLEKLLGDKKTFGSKILAGDIAIFAVLWVAFDLEKDLLKNHPKIQAFYDHIHSQPTLQELLANPPSPYFKRH